jgi:hypothetical protein
VIELAGKTFQNYMLPIIHPQQYPTPIPTGSNMSFPVPLSDRRQEEDRKGTTDEVSKRN